MTIEQTVNIPASRHLTIEVPSAVPAGRVILAFTPAPAAGTTPGITAPAESTSLLAYRTGFLKGQISVPPDFDTMGQPEIAALFEAAHETPA